MRLGGSGFLHTQPSQGSFQEPPQRSGLLQGVTEGLPPTSTPSPAGWLEGPGMGIVFKMCQGRRPRTQGSHHPPFPCCLCLNWSCTLTSGTDFTLVQPGGPRYQPPPHVYECLFAGRGTHRCLARGCSTDSHGQSTDVHPLGEEC